jgi:hypothetical protein
VDTTIIGLIVIPLTIFILGSIYGAVRGAIRFAQYLVRSEEEQRSSSESLTEITDLLKEYMDKTNGELREHGERLTVVEFAVLGKSPRSNHGVQRREA